MENPKQTMSVLLCIFSLISILCFFNNFDISTIIFIVSDIYQLINKRNMILLCHFILIFIVKDSGLLSPRKNDVSVVVENIVPLEFEVKEAELERREEVRESYIIQKSFDIVVMEKAEEIVQTNGEAELDEELMEIMESAGEEEWEDMGKEEVERNGKEVWDLVVMERSGEEEEMENDCVAVMEQTREEEQEKESVDELHRKIEEFIRKMKIQMQQPVLG